MAKAKKKASKKKVAKKKLVKKKKATAGKKVAKKKKAVKKKPTKKAVKAPIKKTNVDWKKSIHPLADRLVVRPEGKSEKTAGGLFIPSMIEDRPEKGEVLACGPGAKGKKGQLRPLDVKVGDSVLFNKHAGVKAEISGESVLILREEEVLGILS